MFLKKGEQSVALRSTFWSGTIVSHTKENYQTYYSSPSMHHIRSFQIIKASVRFFASKL